MTDLVGANAASSVQAWVFSPVITADYISHFLSSTSETVQERRSKECSIKKLQDVVG